MKTRPNDPISTPYHTDGSPMTTHTYDENFGAFIGLTKREYFAAKAMAGYCGGEFIGQSGMPQSMIAEWCVKMADELIEQLNSTSK